MARVSRGLPDHLSHGLRILFVGINPGLRSSQLGHHYAGHSNRFWRLLYESGLICTPMSFEDDWRLVDVGMGFTNLVARPTVGIQDLTSQDFQQGRKALVRKIRKYQPKVIAILGITVARVLEPLTTTDSGKKSKFNGPIQVGLQSGLLAGARLFVLPNPSGRNAHYSYVQMKGLFCELKALTARLILE